MDSAHLSLLTSVSSPEFSCPNEWWLALQPRTDINGPICTRWLTHIPRGWCWCLLGISATTVHQTACLPLCSFSIWCGSKGNNPRSGFPEENKQICFIILRPGIRNLWISFPSQSLHQIITGQPWIQGLMQGKREFWGYYFLKHIPLFSFLLQ